MSRQNQNQKLIQDQHYSNSSFYIMMSTLQSIVHCFQGVSSSKYGNKMFRSYDKFDYSSKNLFQLKGQLQTHIMVFKASMQMWRHSHPKNQWTLPQNFNKEKSIRFIEEKIDFFARMNDHDCVNLSRDILAILNGSDRDCYFEKVDFIPVQSESEKAQHNRNLLPILFQTQNSMDEKLNEIQNVTDPSQLTAKININKEHQHLFEQNSYYQNGYNGFSQNGQQYARNQNNPTQFHPQKQVYFLLIEKGQQHYVKYLHQMGINCQIDISPDRVTALETWSQVEEQLARDYSRQDLREKYMLKVEENKPNHVFYKISGLSVVRYSKSQQRVISQFV